MDLGISGRRAVVCASSRGLGLASARALAEAGCDLAINGRDAGHLERVAEDLRSSTGVRVVAVAGDIGERETQEALLGALPTVDILVNNNAGPPFRDYRDVDRAAIQAGIQANMIVPIELVRAVLDGMVERQFGRIVNITSASVKAPIAGLDLSSGARAGLTGFLAGVARSVAHANVTINFLLPGPFDTQRLRASHQRRAETGKVDLATVSAEARAAIPARRFGRPEEFGAACAFLCSAHAGFITGQSILLDGGGYPGVL